MSHSPATLAGPELKAFLEGALRGFLGESPLNRLEHFGGEPIFTEALVGYARGDDPIFRTFREVVHPEHLLPSDLMGTGDAPTTVVAIALPFHPDTVRSNAAQTEGPSLRWNHSRWHGETFTTALLGHLCERLEAAGIPACAPVLKPGFRIDRTGGLPNATWSHRHAAYAAGLGTFTLNDAFVTARGAAVWLASLVLQADLEATPRPAGDHRAHCLGASKGTCGLCMGRCPAQAISWEGHDRARCMQEVFVGQKPWVEGAHGPGYLGAYAGCGLCLTGVPCSMRSPTE